VKGTARVLVAGIGNVFLGDDGFGVEVVHRIDLAALPEGVDAVDYGIRGVHLAYDLLDGHVDTLVLVDALPMGEPPGTLAVLEADAGDHAGADGEATPVAVEAHSMSPDVVIAALRGLGGAVPRVLVVGCEPAVIDAQMGLSEPVDRAADAAVRMVADLVAAEVVAAELAEAEAAAGAEHVGTG
jgi:hydrogenase maturation protease